MSVGVAVTHVLIFVRFSSRASHKMMFSKRNNQKTTTATTKTEQKIKTKTVSQSKKKEKERKKKRKQNKKKTKANLFFLFFFSFGDVTFDVNKFTKIIPTM